jgi:hypothetical protein
MSLALALSAFAGLGIAQQTTASPRPGRPAAATGSGSGSAAVADLPAPPQTVAANGIVTGYSTKNDVSPPLRTLPAQFVADRNTPPTLENDHPYIPVTHKDTPDPVVQKSNPDLATAPAPAMGTAFQGIGNSADGLGGCACFPPDTTIDVGTTQIVETVNAAFAIYDKTGHTLLAPRNINTLWTGFGGACENRNDGDPIVLWDSLANRWMVSQFTSAKPYNECIAVSQTADATGAWNRYAFLLSTSDWPDYPHLGVWPDGYYMSVNWFVKGHSYGGPRPYVFDRAKMLAGQPATFQTIGAAMNGVNPIHPADLDGAALPPAGSPALFFGFGNGMPLWRFKVDWANSGNTTWTAIQNLPIAGFTQFTSSVAQPGTSQKLDSMGDRLMHRVTYRNFGTYESWTVSHTAAVPGTIAGVRWYEFTGSASSTLSVRQQSTYAPDATNRWMGSFAQDKQGNQAIGFSVSSSSVYPGIRFAGRLATDPLNTMAQGETVALTGTGYQASASRWGDYSSLVVDPVDDCTFWFGTEYNNSATWHWRTQLTSFKFAGCQ